VLHAYFAPFKDDTVLLNTPENQELRSVNYHNPLLMSSHFLYNLSDNLSGGAEK